jgi:antitoxin HicB
MNVKTRRRASDIQQYLELPYTRELVREDDGTWFARILEFPGCMTTGDTQQEALEMLEDAMTAWLRTRLEDRETIPEPVAADDFSGRFVVRVTKSLHRDLVRAAERNGVSLNLFVATTLAQAAGSQPMSAAQPAISYLKVPPRSRQSKRKKA